MVRPVVFVPTGRARRSPVPARHIVTRYKTTIALEGDDPTKTNLKGMLMAVHQASATQSATHKSIGANAPCHDTP